MMALQAPITLAIHSIGSEDRENMIDEVREGLLGTPKRLPSRCFYDARGCELFDAITELPEYYQTRTESQILTDRASDIVHRVCPEAIVELGAGSCTKTPILLDAAVATGSLRHFLPFDISEGAVREAAGKLLERYPALSIYGLVGDFTTHLEGIPRLGRQLIMFLGGTIGNLEPTEWAVFLGRVRELLAPGDAFLLGIDLVKDEAALHAAYNDAAGVTAEFNRNILNVLNRELGADFDVAEFEHVAFYDPKNERIEMRLRAGPAQTVRLPALGLEIYLDPGEEIRTELSAKFTRASIDACLQAADMRLAEWYTDPQQRFGLVLAEAGRGGRKA
jgi:L-histidine Nalpha-methyltransferase